MEPISRRGALISMTRIGLGAAGLPWLVSAAADAGEKRPNIVYIMADDHAAHALSCCGSVINKTPNLDRIAAAGRFDGSQQTFPKLLQKAGYQTAVVGKWHLVTNPTGFDYWNILPGQGRYVDPEFVEMGLKKVVKGYVTDLITDSALDFLKK